MLRRISEKCTHDRAPESKEARKSMYAKPTLHEKRRTFFGNAKFFFFMKNLQSSLRTEALLIIVVHNFDLTQATVRLVGWFVHYCILVYKHRAKANQNCIMPSPQITNYPLGRA